MYLKLETLQPSFSYKIRGAWNAVLRLRERGEGSRGLVTASAGNHGRALAIAAKAAGLELRVYAPAAAPKIKLDAIRAAGAALRACGDYDAAEAQAKDDAARSGAIYVSPYSHPDVIAGAGTVGLEILEDLPGADLVVVPVGGGGLISGVALAVQGSGAAVAGVEAEASCPFTRGLAAGRIVTVTVAPTLADGLAGNLDPDTITFGIVKRLVGEIVLVPEDGIREAIRGIASEERLIAEGAAATGAAAVLARRFKSLRERSRAGAGRQRVAVVLSGANIDPDTLRRII